MSHSVDDDQVDQPAPRDGDEQVLLMWPARVRTLLNGPLWKGLAVAFGSGAALVCVIFLLAGSGSTGLLVGGGLFLGIMALVAVVFAVIDLFGGLGMTFALTTEGVHSVAGKRAAAASDAAVVVGVLAGNMSAMGAGLLARSEKNAFIPYGDVRKIKLGAGRRYVLVKGGFLDKPIGLYCTAENYDPALKILRERCAKATFCGA
ncbi:MAG: hypothetical protein NTV05_02210 [Acidobacteria bacterium]|nr:hypothetical protein [Acidobacteriota bacterium]